MVAALVQFFGRLFGGKKRILQKAGLYLDGGLVWVRLTCWRRFGWHYVDGPKAFGTLWSIFEPGGALTFRKTVEALSSYKLVCIDEFELDDPGDTVLMSRLMRETGGCWRESLWRRRIRCLVPLVRPFRG